MTKPRPQQYLSKDAKRLYNKICKHLEDADALEDIDSFGLSMMAHSLDLYRQAAEEVGENGPIQKYNSGAENISAWFSVMKESLANFLKYSQRFGMTPKDRELMVKFAKKKRETDALDLL